MSLPGCTNENESSNDAGSLTIHTTAPPSIQPQDTAQKPLHPFYSLPCELIFDIVDLLPAEAFINFAFANYPLLLNYGLAPSLSHPRVTYLTSQTQIPALFPLLKIPPEITLHVLEHLKPIDTMRFVVANYQDLARQGIAPPLSAETVQQLWNAMRAGTGSRVVRNTSTTPEVEHE